MLTIQGTLRADAKTKDLTKRLKPGEIAVIRHRDIDATAAAALIDCKPSAVINVEISISGRYPNRGPEMILNAGIPLVDGVICDNFDLFLKNEGTIATLADGTIRLRDGYCASGSIMTQDRVAVAMERATENLGAEIQAFAKNTLEYIQQEQSLLLDPLSIPDLKTTIKGRHALVVVRGEGYREDLMSLRPFIQDVRPVVIAVDGGADALLSMGIHPDILFGDMDSVSDAALRSGAELVVHGYVTGNRQAPGLERLSQLGLKASVLHAPGTSEDVAILMADELGATVIVAVGTHFSMVEFLDKGRRGMASTFLVRLRTGAKLVDAKGIGRLWEARSKPYPGEILFLVAAALFPVGVIIFYSPWFRTLLTTLRLTFGGH